MPYTYRQAPSRASGGGRRLLCLGPGWLLVHDRLRSTREHSYSWLYHDRAGKVEAGCATRAPKPVPGLPPGMQYLKNMRRGTTGQAWQAWFQDQQVGLLLCMEGKTGTEVLTATGPGRSIAERIPMVMATRKGKEASFTALLIPCRAGEARPPPPVLETRMEQGVTTIAVRQEERRFTCVLDLAPGKAASGKPRHRIRCAQE